jgi:dihydrofolate reductase
MHKIVMFNRVSADGYFADEHGGLDWTVADDQLDQEAATGMPSSGTMLFGRKTYDIFESFWPHASDEDPHAAGRHNPAIKRMAEWINAALKIVFSRTKKEVTWNNSRLISHFDPDEVRKLKADSDKDIMIFGSGSIVSLLSQHRLIDEYRFVVGPQLLGKGQQMIRDMPQALRLSLAEVKQYSSGNVQLRYVPTKG